MKALSCLFGRADHFASDTFPCRAVFENKARLRRKALLHDNDSALRVDAKGEDIERHLFPLKGDVDVGLHAQEHPLAAAAFFVGHRLPHDSADRRFGRNQIGFR